MATPYYSKFESDAKAGGKIDKFIKSNEALTGAQRKGDVLYGILDQYTGEEMTLSKVTGTPTVDNVIYFQLGSEYFKRNCTEINLKWFGGDIIIPQMFNYSNSIFVIDKDYDLGGNSFTILSNSILKFRNSKLSNGRLDFQSGCKIENNNNKLILNEIIISGILNCETRSSYFENADDDILFDNLVRFRKAYLEKSIFLDTIYTVYVPSNRRIDTSFELVGVGNVTISSQNSLFGGVAENGGVDNFPAETAIIGNLSGIDETVKFSGINFLDIEYDELNTTAQWDNSLSFINIVYNNGQNNTIILDNCAFKTTGQNVGFNKYSADLSVVLSNFYASNCKFESSAWPSIGSFNATIGSGIKEIIVDNCTVANGTTFVNKTDITNVLKVSFSNCITNGFFEIISTSGLDNLEVSFLNCKSNNSNRLFEPYNSDIVSEIASGGKININDCNFNYINSSFVRGFKNVTIEDTNITINKTIDLLYNSGNFIVKNVNISKTKPNTTLSFQSNANYFLNNVKEITNGMAGDFSKTATLTFITGVIKEFFNVDSTVRYLNKDFVIKKDLLIFNDYSNNFHSIPLNDIDTCENGSPYSISNGAISGIKTINFSEASSTNVLMLDFDINILKKPNTNLLFTSVYIENKTNAAVKYGASIYIKINLLINNRNYQDSNIKNDISLGKHHVRIYFSQNIVYVYLNDMLFDFYAPDFSFTTINLMDFKLVMQNTNDNVELTNVKLLQL
jgi:hypothetical protein